MSDDPERLLAEALRAQARNAPPAGPAPRHATPDADPAGPAPVETPGGYGLLSGAGEGSLERERAALDAQTPPSPRAAEPAPSLVAQPAGTHPGGPPPHPTEPSGSRPGGTQPAGPQPALTRTAGGRHHRADAASLQLTPLWIVFLAAILGLACGCVIGLLTIA